MNFRDHIVRDRAICGGEPVLKGTRVPLRVVLHSLADGDSPELLLREHPTLTEEHVRAAIAFAAAVAAEELPQQGPLPFVPPPRLTDAGEAR
jgi:uncharacterized protein (DUF433 family)